MKEEHFNVPLGLIQAESLGALQFNLGKTEPPREKIERLTSDSSSGKEGGEVD